MLLLFVGLFRRSWCKFNNHVLSLGDFTNDILVNDNAQSFRVDVRDLRDAIGIDAELFRDPVDEVAYRSPNKIDCSIVWFERIHLLHVEARYCSPLVFSLEKMA